ncbi:PREDICTED: proline-rich protein PRCC [Poecilia mexicana]|uniref:Proline rich mitotic checkpoint control factor n=1 Tax=Poecilia mexicana TaxID=48701 RepID=A0A3B3YH76_9TELE|nr:PREDICTED: proline-rich protein PRCC [Poecilia mexicana]
MSLVAYGSSDESDSEETSTSAAAESKPSGGGLFSFLPAPKASGSAAGGKEVASRAKNSAAKESTGGFLSSLPKPKKRTEPVKIPVPQLQRRDSDSDDDEPVPKKLQTQGAGSGSGLSSILPKPKNLTVKEMDRPLIPHTLTKRPDLKAPKPGAAAPGLLGSSASPSAIKAAAKSAALQVAKQIAAEDQNNEEDITPQNYFSLEDDSQPLPDVVPIVDPEPAAPAEPCPYVAADEPGQSNAPLDFGGSHEGASAWDGQYDQYQQPMAGPETFPEGYYDAPYYQNPDPELAEAEPPDNSTMFDDEGFMRLQGKRNRGKEEVKFLEIKGDDQLSGNQQWMTKSISEEKQTRQSYSKRRGDQPTGQQRRKHQITYLIHQAKEREIELKNNWAENRMTRRQTQAKYGF